MITPLNDRILIQVSAPNAVSSSGIEVIQNKTARATTISEGTVLAVASGSELEAGDTVIFNEGWGNELTEPGVFLIKESDVLARVLL